MVRVFMSNGGILRDHKSWDGFRNEFADILIVCGQGVYEKGIYYGEFNDRDVYFEHAAQTHEVAKRFNYNCVVFSGGFTQEYAPWTSEAESIPRIINDAAKGNELPASVPCFLDETALDSAENLLFGLMMARIGLGDAASIRRIGIYAAWTFKKWRFNRNAEALGIVEQTYFHSFAGTSSTSIRVPEDDARQRYKEEYDADSAELNLLRTQDKEEKRAKRWQNNRDDPNSKIIWQDDSPEVYSTLTNWVKNGEPKNYLEITMEYKQKTCACYRNRLANLERHFPQTMQALQEMAKGRKPKECGLAGVFKQEVMSRQKRLPAQRPIVSVSPKKTQAVAEEIRGKTQGG